MEDREGLAAHGGPCRTTRAWLEWPSRLVPTGRFDELHGRSAGGNTRLRAGHCGDVRDRCPLPDRLEVTGQPVLDLWVKLNRPDAHIAARLETFDADGREIRSGLANGLRSAQHVEPLRNGLFMQERGVPAPVATPMRIPVRFGPTDLVVPKGGNLRLTIAGSMMQNRGALRRLNEPTVDEPSFPFSYGLMPTALVQSAPSGANTTVEVLHDCVLGASTLRFEMPDEKPKLINVQEADEVAPVQDQPLSEPFVSDGGGIATRSVCGR
jgi:hypothetical protein